MIWSVLGCTACSPGCSGPGCRSAGYLMFGAVQVPPRTPCYPGQVSHVLPLSSRCPPDVMSFGALINNACGWREILPSGSRL